MSKPVAILLSALVFSFAACSSNEDKPPAEPTTSAEPTDEFVEPTPAPPVELKKGDTVDWKTLDGGEGKVTFVGGSMYDQGKDNYAQIDFKVENTGEDVLETPGGYGQFVGDDGKAYDTGAVLCHLGKKVQELSPEIPAGRYEEASLCFEYPKAKGMFVFEGGNILTPFSIRPVPNP